MPATSAAAKAISRGMDHAPVACIAPGVSTRAGAARRTPLPVAGSVRALRARRMPARAAAMPVRHSSTNKVATRSNGPNRETPRDRDA